MKASRLKSSIITLLIRMCHVFSEVITRVQSYLPAGEGTGGPAGTQSATCGPQEAARPRHHPCHPGSDWVRVTRTCRRLVYWARSWSALHPCTWSGGHRVRWCTWTPQPSPLRWSFQTGDRSWNKLEFYHQIPGCSVWPPWCLTAYLLRFCVRFKVFFFSHDTWSQWVLRNWHKQRKWSLTREQQYRRADPTS